MGPLNPVRLGTDGQYHTPGRIALERVLKVSVSKLLRAPMAFLTGKMAKNRVVLPLKSILKTLEV